MIRNIKFALIAGFSLTAGIIALIPSSGTAAASSSELASPRTLYIQNCARCHGANGHSTAKGQAMDAPDLAGPGKSSSSIIRTVKNGKGDMPSFGKRLNAKQIASIAGYVRSL